MSYAIDQQKQPGVIGFVGLGLMGSAMAKNIVDHGHTLVGYDVRGELKETVQGWGGSLGF